MSTESRPLIIGFLCNWCSYAAADLAGTSRYDYPPNVLIIRVPCSGRVDPVFVLKALLSGADGVLIGACHPGDCHYSTGNLYARRRYNALQKLLDTVGIDRERVRMEFVSASEGKKFARVVTDFTNQLKEMGPSPLRTQAV
ncbi:MAG: Methyl-viologen-reducing hydrogenase delta subunit [Clostridia bacterium 62_21]|nr:MAG: Methyl-viologen-reducing hydrogenase delta subunit [Clostridia bacterium 62_21]HAG07417.1 hypothetical protein [Peptococcaceae bacterium]